VFKYNFDLLCSIVLLGMLISVCDPCKVLHLLLGMVLSAYETWKELCASRSLFLVVTEVIVSPYTYGPLYNFIEKTHVVIVWNSGYFTSKMVCSNTMLERQQ